MIDLVREPIDPDALRRSVERPEHGGVVVFCGEVRAVTKGVVTKRIVYTGYEEMALDGMQKIASKASERWEADVALVHRLGEMVPGDIAVVAAASCAHRPEAFECCRFLIDTLKADVPIWKEEFGEDGSAFVEGERRVPR